jgi:class 3 adenylate cyclase
MLSWTRVLVGLGISADQSHSEQRRIRTINVVSLFAFSATVFFAIVFLPARPAGISFWEYLGLALVYLAGYGATLGLNWRGLHDRAVVVLLSTGLVNIVGATLTVGFRAGPAVFLVTVAMGAALLTRPEHRLVRRLFVVLSAVAYSIVVVIDPDVTEWLEDGIESLLAAASYGGMIAFVVTVVWYQRRFADRAEEALTEANELSERLLLNILPTEIAARLKADEYPIADRKTEVTVLFADIVGSTAIADRLTAAELVTTLDDVFSAFDDIADRIGLEKIKTVGDGYFAVAGLTSTVGDHASSAADAALLMRAELKRHHFPGVGRVHMRFGLDTGPVIAGVIGKRKFSYDVWGDTVNTASRMESPGDTDMIQVTQRVYDRLKSEYDFRPRGQVAVRGKGNLQTYELIGRGSP